jgi:superfamily II DNA helicase RecQ
MLSDPRHVDVVQAILSGRNVILGTNTGKVDSEIHAQLVAEGKNVVVVTPLTSLARKSRFPLTVTPERLGEVRFADVALVEHGECVLDWGEKFKPDFARVGNFREGVVPILVFCGSSRHLERVGNFLGVKSPVLFRSSMNRKNVQHLVKPKRGLKTLTEDLSAIQGSIVIFCASKKEVEETRQLLDAAGDDAITYHADLGYEKETKLAAWEGGEIRILLTTTSSTWLDKPDVRLVVFTTMPKSLETFSLLSSLAGRDGESAAIYLYFDFTDKALFELRSPGNEASDDLLKMVAFGEYGHRCKRQQLGEFFNELKTVCQTDESQCTTCCAPKLYKEIDRSEEAAQIQQLCQTGNRVSLRPFTLISLRDAAMGSRSANSEISGFGCLKGKFPSAAKALSFLRFLVLEKFLGERTIGLDTVHGGHATYVHVGVKRGVVVFPEEVTKKRKLQAEKFVGLDEDDADTVERLMPASLFELEWIGLFPSPQRVLAAVDSQRPKFKYAHAFEGLFE